MQRMSITGRQSGVQGARKFIMRMTEERVKLFNDRLKGQLIPQIIWLDSHDYLMGVGVHASDGVHYKDDTNLVLYQYYLSMIGAV